MRSRIAGALAGASILSAMPAAAASVEPQVAPEPSVLALIALVVVAVVTRQVRKLRRPRAARLH